MIGVCVPLLSALLLAHPSSGVLGVDGRTHHPLKESHGRPLTLIFVSHDCPICNAYAPEFGRIQAAYGARVAFDLVYAEPRLTAAQAKAHATAFALDRWTLLLDHHCRFAGSLKASVTPEAFVFDGNGRLVYSGRIDDRYIALGQQRAQVTTHDLRNAVDSVLAHKTPKPAETGPVGCFIVRP